MTSPKNARKPDTRCLSIILIICCLATFAVGILIGRFATCPEDKVNADKDGVFLPGASEWLVNDGDPEIGTELMREISAENIRENLRMLSMKPHLSGTEENHELGIKIKEHWESAGLDQVTLTPYRVMLSYPNTSDPNYVELLDGSNKSQYKSDLTEAVLTSEENKTGVVPPFNAYSAAGEVYGDLVYVNFGTVADYEYLANNKSINITGKIVMARYGLIFRGDKVKQAQIRGAIGVILFSDPSQVSGGDINQVYPHDWWLPPSGVQRGTIRTSKGDPLTADYPATETAYREMPSDLPKIPCHPIGYGGAVHIMRELDGEEVPPSWRGGMNVTYRFGNGFRTQGWKAHIKVSTYNKMVTTYNAIGIIRGRIEPDRYVLFGNHRDAWIFGAMDPSSGTAVMMEISRVMGQLVKSGRWRPRRSIIFCSWGAEEYGHVGSTEWVEHYVKNLGARAVAYLNVDIAVWGNHSLGAQGTPLLYKPLIEASKKVSNPNDAEVAAGRASVYDSWLAAFPDPRFDRPGIALPGSGSDYSSFRDRLGIPILDTAFVYNLQRYPLSIYPMYHTVYETFYLVDKIMDRGFKCHKAISQVFVELARSLADSLVLPFNVSDYPSVVKSLANTLISTFGQQMNANELNTSLLNTALDNFTKAVEDFEQQIQSADTKDPFVVRRINDQLMQLDRAFLDPAGLPGRKLKRHILFAESSVNVYGGSGFPGLADALSEIQLGNNVDEQWKIAQKHFSVILFSLQSAASTLKDVTDFMYDY